MKQILPPVRCPKRCLYLLGGLALLIGCVRKVEAPISAREPWVAVYHEAESSTGFSASLPASSGSPLSLDAALDLAFSNSPLTKAAWFEAKAAAAARRKAYADFYPQVSGSFTFDRKISDIRFSSNTLTQQQTASSPQIAISYTLLDFGSRSAVARSAEEALVSSNYHFNRALQQLGYETQRRYFLLHAAVAAVTANLETIKEAKRSLQAAQKSFELGSKPKQDVLQAEAGLRKAEFELEDSKALVEDARASFAEILGQPVSTALQIDAPNFDALEHKTPNGGIEQLVQQALIARPDLQASYADARGAVAQLDFAERKSLPRLVTSGSLGKSYIYGEDGSQRSYAAGLELQVPIFTGFETRHSIDQARQQEMVARERSRSVELSVAREVWSAFFRFEAASRQTRAARALVAATGESYRAVEQGYRNGSNSVLDLLASQRELSDARKGLIGAQASCAISYAAMQLAIGSL